MKKQEILPFSLQLVQGAIGKEFVIKHYKYGIIKTKFPDMSQIIPSAKQKIKRNLFTEAVAFAKEVIADKERKAAWQKRLKKRNSVYNAAIKDFMLRQKRKKEKELHDANDLLVKVFKKQSNTETYMHFNQCKLVSDPQPTLPDHSRIFETAHSGFN